MAELAASIIGIISAGSKVALILSTVASDVGSAGKEAQVVAREVRSFCAVLRGITKTVDDVIGNAEQMEHCRDVISEMTDVSREMFIEILNLTEDLQKAAWGSRAADATGNDASPRLNLARRIKWAFSKPKLTFLRSAIEAYKADLNLVLGTIQVAQGLASKSSAGVSSPVTSQQLQRASQDLEQLVSDYQASLQDLEATRDTLDDAEDQGPLFSAAGDMLGETEADKRVLSMIESIRSEVNSLHSASSRVNSMASSSIYESLSRNSVRLSLLADNLPLPNAPFMQNLGRISRRMSLQSRAGPPRPSSILPSVQEANRDGSWTSGSQALQDMEKWPRSTSHALTREALSMIAQLRGPLNTMDPRTRQAFYTWVGLVTRDLTSRRPDQAQQYLSKLSSKAEEMRGPTRPLSLLPPSPSSAGLQPSRRSPSPAKSPNDLNQALSVSRSRSPGRSPDFTSPNQATGDPGDPGDQGMVEIFKTFRVSLDDPCYKVIPVALKKYQITAPWQEYQLYIVWDGEERLVGLNEKPLILFKQYDKEGKKPMFMLRKIVNGATVPAYDPPGGII
ncbi:hypothetical protein OQA88_13363 [Cercophora sp. LCS_1]